MAVTAVGGNAFVLDATNDVLAMRVRVKGVHIKNGANVGAVALFGEAVTFGPDGTPTNQTGVEIWNSGSLSANAVLNLDHALGWHDGLKVTMPTGCRVVVFVC